MSLNLYKVDQQTSKSLLIVNEIGEKILAYSELLF